MEFDLLLFFSYRPAPKNEDEMMIAIFECIDRMFSIVRPRKLLYMAIDGVVGVFYLESCIFYNTISNLILVRLLAQK